MLKPTYCYICQNNFIKYANFLSCKIATTPSDELQLMAANYNDAFKLFCKLSKRNVNIYCDYFQLGTYCGQLNNPFQYYVNNDTFKKFRYRRQTNRLTN